VTVVSDCVRQMPTSSHSISSSKCGWRILYAFRTDQVFSLSRSVLQWAYSGPSNFERFDVRTTWNSKKNSRGTRFWSSNNSLKVEHKTLCRHMVAFSLNLVSRAVARSVLPWLVQWASRKFSLFLSVLFISFGYIYIIFNNTHSYYHKKITRN
jgi:hypothetical protein